MSKYFKNFILCGDIDHHCLLCKESFQTVDDLEKHIRWEKHRKCIKGLIPMPKFKKDGIYKIDDKYYCEHCNHIITTVAAISKHVEETLHQETKGEPTAELKGTLCKRESGLIVIDKIKITNREWNGVVDSKCIFCNVAVDNFVKHISMSTHMINMIQSEILVNEEHYYRKMNEEDYYCFLCKKTFSAQSLSDHCTDKLHLEKTKAQNGTNEQSEQAKKLDIAIKLINSQRDYFDIDVENKVAMCKICTAYVNINFKFMVEHKKTHNITDKDKIEQAPVDMDEVLKSLKCKKPERDEEERPIYYDHGKLRAELAKYGKEHFIKLVFPGSRGYCSLCGTYISAHMKQFTEHVRGQIHMGHLELKGLDKGVKRHAKPVYKTKKLNNFIKHVTHSKVLKVLWLNKKFCLDIFSFMLVSMIDEGNHCNKFKCYACDIIYDHAKDGEHCNTEHHKAAFYNSDVITTMKGEFIREIRPNLYHCGICNLIFPFWETLDKHLVSWKHVFTKNDKNQMLVEDIEALALSLNQDRVFANLIGLGLVPK